MNTYESLNDEQKSVIDFLLKGNNVALLGPAGVGKSYLLSVIEAHLPGMMRRMRFAQGDTHPRLPRIQICALTGCAALLLGHKAKTLHSWAGIGLGKGTVQELYIKIRRNRKALQQWLVTDLLIIDEISMMTAELLDKLNDLGKKIRNSRQPFGGLQVLLVGDFFQLPPVNKSDEPTQFSFQSQAWKEGISVCIELKQIQRQKDVCFQRILMEARSGQLSKESCDTLRSLEGRDWRNNKIKPTLLFPRRSEVELINDSNLRALKGRRETYKAGLVYDGKMPSGFIESDVNFQQSLARFDTDAPYAVQLELVQDAQVMLIANLDQSVGLVNGSRGVIVGFCEATNNPIVEFMNGIRRPIGFHTWALEEEYSFVSRTQVPLRLAWAVTTHKCQGASLDCALVDIGSGNFEYGQAYVALSRARTLEGLYVHDFEPTAFRAHPAVKTFYSGLVVSQMSEEERNMVRKQATAVPEHNEKAVFSEATRIARTVNVIKEPGIAEKENELDDKEEPGQVTTTNWLYDSVPHSWKSILSPCEKQLHTISQSLDTKIFLPQKEQIWTALELTPFEQVKVVILGQDPYPTAGHAHGLAFSLLPDVRPLAASLRNIYKELQSDLEIAPPPHGNLQAWAERGVLLLNTVLTVEEGNPQSHTKIGWEEITDHIIRSLSERKENIVFVLWGKSAQVKKKIIHATNHRILESAHPSPLSASKGFFGSKPFSRINELLAEMGQEKIEWNL
jgi:ATP-dependent DNA helicase PIF1